MEPIDAEYRFIDKRPPQPVTWRAIWRGSPWLITAFGIFDALALLAVIWYLLTN